jgi:hypothetical protein
MLVSKKARHNLKNTPYHKDQVARPVLGPEVAIESVARNIAFLAHPLTLGWCSVANELSNRLNTIKQSKQTKQER